MAIYCHFHFEKYCPVKFLSNATLSFNKIHSNMSSAKSRPFGPGFYVPSDGSIVLALQLPHNGRDGVSNNQPHYCLLNRLIRRRSKKTSKFRVTGLCAGKSTVTGEVPAQMASNAENVSISWRHHGGHRMSHHGAIHGYNADFTDSFSPMFIWPSRLMISFQWLCDVIGYGQKHLLVKSLVTSCVYRSYS